MPCLTSMLREFLAWISRAWVSLRRDWLAQHARQRNLGLPARVEPHFCVVPPQILHRGFPIPPIQADSNPDLTAEYQSKTGIKPTRFVHRSSWLPPTSIPIFPHQKAKKSRHQQHLVSYNPTQTTPKRKQRGWPACPGITPWWAGCHPRTHLITVSRTPHPCSQGKTSIEPVSAGERCLHVFLDRNQP